MPDFCGSLAGIGLPPIVRLLASLRQTGRLRLSPGLLAESEPARPHPSAVPSGPRVRGGAALWLVGGQVAAAALGPERGPAALEALAILSWGGECEFVFSAGEVPARRDVAMTAREWAGYLDALEEAAARVAAGATVPPSLWSVPRLAAPAVEHPDDRVDGRPGDGAARWARVGSVALSRSAIHTLLAVDGRRTVDDIARIGPTGGPGGGLVGTIRNLATLSQTGLVCIDALPALCRPRARAGAPVAPVAPGQPAAGRVGGRSGDGPSGGARRRRRGFDPSRLAAAQRPAAVIPQIVGAAAAGSA
jgi:hypothetical protein